MSNNLVFLAVVVGVLVLVAKLLPELLAQTSSDQAGYEACGPLLTPAERSLYGVLLQAVGERTSVMCKVRLADLVKVKDGVTPKMRAVAFNKIQSKHVDFILCDAKTMKVERVVELDDKSHLRDNRKRRDAFVDEALKSAGIPVVRITAKATYSIPEVREKLWEPAGALESAT